MLGSELTKVNTQMSQDMLVGVRMSGESVVMDEAIDFFYIYSDIY